MNKLSELLSNLGQSAPTKLGFGQARERKRNPVMLLIGVFEFNLKSLPQSSAVDIAIYRHRKSGRPVTAAPDGSPKWGASLSDCTLEDLDAIKAAGGDFIVIESDSAPGLALRDDDLARGYPIPTTLTEERAHAIDDMPFDFLIARGLPAEWPLSVGRTLTIQETVSQFSKHMFFETANLPTAPDLQILRDMPISGLVIDPSAHSEKKLDELREALAGLEPRKPRSEHMAVLPAGASNGSSAHTHEAEPDDDDDDFDDQ